MTEIDLLAANTIRVLSTDAVEKANSGHPGMPMGMADLAVVLWSKYLNVDPTDPTWPDRDRFVLSNGHGSMLLYSLLHLSGFPLSMEEIKNFRQWGYETAGHPEAHQAIGIETTTGPLGQGISTAVGMAIAEEHLRAVHGPDLTDHRTFVFCGDGDLMEGVASEAASLAGHLGLGRLIVFYDDNSITIDGSTDLAFTEDVPARFAAYGWQTMTIDGHDHAAIDAAIQEALADDGHPTLISCKTHIGYTAPTKVDTASAHGSPLGDDEIMGAREAMGWELEPFEVPEEVYAFFHTAMERGTAANQAWKERLAAAPGDVRDGWDRYWNPTDVTLDAPSFDAGSAVATRKQSHAVIQQLGERRPDVMSASGDLAGSTNSLFDASHDFTVDDRTGRNIRAGVREHGMAAALNGITQHGGLRGMGATFMTFSDYMRPSVRLAALMEVPSVFIWTHDSIFLGEDGPTHQPIEHLAALRAIPNLDVHRPADPTETAVAWEESINRVDGPSGIVLTRQGLRIPEAEPDRADVRRGAYVRLEGDDVVLVATGSEVPLAEDAAAILGDAGISVRVVSMPCFEAFERQDADYRSAVLGTDLPVFSVEAGATFGWSSIVANGGEAIGIDHFGASAPAGVLAEQFGFTPESVAARVQSSMQS